jgi:hypothetical protein
VGARDSYPAGTFCAVLADPQGAAFGLFEGRTDP